MKHPFLIGVSLGLLTLVGGVYCLNRSDNATSVPFEGQASIGSRLLSAAGDADADPTHVIVDGDEMPGIGALVERPDTALVYFNQKDRRIHIKYLNPSR